MTSRPISADPRARLNAARLAETKVPLPRTAAGRTPMLSAGQLEAVYDRMHSQAEESRLKAQQREREQRRAMREQCTCVSAPKRLQMEPKWNQLEATYSGFQRMEGTATHVNPDAHSRGA